MNKLVSSDKVYISQSKILKAGRGVYARINIKKGETIERCPVIEIPPHEAVILNKSMLVTYLYYLGENKNRLTLVLGFGSLYNHANPPNAVYKAKSKEKVVEFIALREIKKNEEITVNYSQGKQKDQSPLWFKVI